MKLLQIHVIFMILAGPERSEQEIQTDDPRLKKKIQKFCYVFNRKLQLDFHYKTTIKK